jgi:hypothetical protein
MRAQQIFGVNLAGRWRDQCRRRVRRRGLSMPNDLFAAFLHTLPIMLGGLLVGFAIVGFWRGLSLRRHEREHRPAPPPFWWYTGP